MRRKDEINHWESYAETAALRAPSIRRRLLAAYDAGKRTLPWRGETDPYRIWVSEIMLQQTRVDTVIPYYGRWLDQFPDIETLAEAEEDEVLRVWQGLGYYSRARRLQEGARVVRETLGGVVPGSSEALRELPGVGEYTAGAVASIAFGEVVPAVDGNVKRVLSRLFDLEAPTPGQFRELAQVLVDPKRPGDFNQALMELGALVCIPRSPGCGDCPVAEECRALDRGTVALRPAPKEKRSVPQVDVVVLVVAARDQEGRLHFLLRKRPHKGLLAGMWEFPGVEVEPGADSSVVGLPGGLTELDTVSHVFSHLKALYRPHLWETTQSGEGGPDLPAYRLSNPFLETGPPRWIPADELDRIPIPVAQAKIAAAALEFLGR
jgi:A/G-specific adenine glycosylase